MIAVTDEEQIRLIEETEGLKHQLQSEHRQKIEDRLTAICEGSRQDHPSYTRHCQQLVEALLEADESIDGFSAIEFMLAGSLVRMKDDAMRRWLDTKSGVQKMHYCRLHGLLVSLDPNNLRAGM